MPDFDRFARDVVKARVLEDQLATYGVRVIYQRVPLDDTPEGRLLKNQLLSFAEYERGKIALRTARGRRAKAERGLVVGSGPAPYGYCYTHGDKGQRIGLEGDDPDTAATARRIFDLLRTRSTNDVEMHLRQDHIPPPRGAVRYRARDACRPATTD
jgi:site-specific DNA recombinase